MAKSVGYKFSRGRVEARPRALLSREGSNRSTSVERAGARHGGISCRVQRGFYGRIRVEARLERETQSVKLGEREGHRGTAQSQTGHSPEPEAAQPEPN